MRFLGNTRIFFLGMDMAFGFLLWTDKIYFFFFFAITMAIHFVDLLAYRFRRSSKRKFPDLFRRILFSLRASLYIATSIGLAVYHLCFEYLFLPVITGFLLRQGNGDWLHHRTFRLFSLICFLAPVFLLYFLDTSVKYKGGFLIFILILSMHLFSKPSSRHRGKEDNVSMKEPPQSKPDMLSSEERERLFNLQAREEYHEFSSNLILHDIRNILFRLTGKMALMVKRKQCFSEGGELADAVSKEIIEKLELLKKGKQTDVNLYEKISQLTIEFENVDFRLDEDSLSVFKKVNFPFFISVIKNLIENSLEACERKGISPQIRFFMSSSDELIYEDNAGGFDHSKIAQCYSSKEREKEEHGIFLYTLKYCGGNFGIETEITSIEEGSRFALKLIELDEEERK